MSEKKSLLVDKSRMPLAVGIAFVAFTTQFGGGFASGAQIYSYFINYGIWCLFLPVFTQFLYALFFWYGMRYAYRNRLYDYRSFSDHFYGRYRAVFSNLFELTYLIMIATASAAAFATGGSTLNTLFQIPYWLCTLLVGAFIFLIALYGTDMVRRVASTLSVLIIAGLVAVLVPNIIAQWGEITASASKMAGGSMCVASGESGSFGAALWSAFLYFLFQLPSVSVMYQHMEPLTSEKQVNHAAVYIFITNTLAMMLTIVGLLAVAFAADLATASVPMLVLVQNGVGTGVLTPVIAALMILGSVSTGVNMVSGIVTRCVNAVERRIGEPEKRKSGHRLRNVGFSLLFTAVAFVIAQFGLMAVVKKGYAYLGYAALVSVFLPFVVRFLADGKKRRRTAE
ncbi:hypothetical protein EQM14_11110 [Caproiciproducens sp. NJN-50]|uniref:YkvI family membrane protein n=1 Tax=Acutalibacteraceae TaxID=3082771 RepID=UPI000FFE0421|nr:MULTISPECIES: hypothetical protein [Acutalibacteraceae]QAT50266.1 hypothetical protein EQM14_11110 [Caproiciproducens sp. NJN-50]